MDKTEKRNIIRTVSGDTYYADWGKYDLDITNHGTVEAKTIEGYIVLINAKYIVAIEQEEIYYA